MINQKQAFYALENIYNLSESGISIVESIAEVSKKINDKKLKLALENVVYLVEEGNLLWESFEKNKIFPHYVVSLIKIGEESGSLQENFRLALINEEKRFYLNNKIITALSYPLFVLVTTFFVGLGIMWFVLPKLNESFLVLRVEIPIQTRILIAIGNFFAKWGVIFVPSMIAIILILVYFLFFFKNTKFIGERMQLSTPLIKKIVVSAEASRMGYMLGSLLNAGYSFIEALTLLKGVSNNHYYKEYYQKVIYLIDEGKTMDEVIRSIPETEMLFPDQVPAMIIFAEKSGSFLTVFQKIGKRYEKELYGLAKSIPSILEPAILILVWFAVLGLSYSIIGPMYALLRGL